MDAGSLKALWTRSLSILENEISDISLKTWISPLEPVSAENGEFVLVAPNDFHRTYADQYVPLIQNTLKSISSRDFKVRIVLQGHESLANGVAARGSPSDPPEESGDFRSVPVGRAQLHPNYPFEGFVVGSGNRFAHAASVAVADKPGGRNFNPLFMYGGSGLGKTHLMHAISATADWVISTTIPFLLRKHSVIWLHRYKSSEVRSVHGRISKIDSRDMES